MISLYRDLIKGNHPVKRFHLLIFYFHKSRNDAIAIVCIYGLILSGTDKKRSFFRNSIFTLLFFETANEFQDDASEWSATGLVNPMGQISSCRLDSLYISERSSRFARTASMYLSSSASVGLDSLRTSSVYSFFPNGKNCIHCSRIHLRLAGSIHQEQ